MTTLETIREDPRKLIPRPILHRLYEWGPRRRRRWEQWPGLVCVAAGNHAVLTFDDGPDEGTLDVLRALDDIHARATFFVLGEQVDRHPQIAEEIIARGHELGVHGYRHVRLDRLRPEEARRDIAATVKGLEALGCRPSWFRPPYGYPTPAAFEGCAELGLTFVYWTSWGLDWEVRRAEWIADRVGRGLADGAIVLLHDSARYAPRPDTRPTADAIRLIGAAASEGGLELVSVGEAIKET